MLKNRMFLLAVFLFSSTLMADNVIDPPGNVKFRCNEAALTSEECDYDRTQALKSGCITQAELDLIISYNGCPACKIGKNGPQYVTWCPLGCFVRGTKILVWDSNINGEVWTAIEIIVQNPSRFKVAALRSDSTKADLDYDFFPIRLTTTGPELKPLVMIHLEDGRTLGVTSTHGIVRSNGVIVAAETLQVGDQILSNSREYVKISQIDRPNTDDDVFNLSVETDSNVSHLIIAEGLVVGDQFLQGSNALNSTILE